ncbi:hypothetical protein [Nocardiopsis synnemataformans]|uniref:hypothetical protein n=1 Tax=Nocardiopsis synnemataformans TaxID=61305 RepID=UPI003EB90B04
MATAGKLNGTHVPRGVFAQLALEVLNALRRAGYEISEGDRPVRAGGLPIERLPERLVLEQPITLTGVRVVACTRETVPHGVMHTLSPFVDLELDLRDARVIQEQP